MPEASPARVLVVSLGSGARVALPAERVRAVAPVPILTRVPGAAAALAGLATIRGGALPVLDLARLLDPEAPPGPAGRMVLAEAGEPVGLLVGRVVGLTPDPGPVPILDLPPLVAGSAPRRAGGAATAPPAPRAGAPPAPPVALLMLAVAGAPYALPLDEVEAVVGLPGALAPAPEGGAAALGMTTWRGRTLPLLSLPALLGRGPGAGRRAAVLRGVGLVAERVGPVLRVPPEAIDPAPRALRRGGLVAGFARRDAGSIPVCILSAQALVGEGERDFVRAAPVPATTEPVVVIDLAGERYGLPAGAVRAVMRAPETLARVPRAPEGVAGLLAVRGGALPVLDPRGCLGLPPGPRDGRLVVIEAGGVRAGLLVDRATRLARPEAGAIRPAPASRGAVATRVADLADGPLPLIDPAHLLAGLERPSGPAARPA
ncbi:chemotaxis protein CheW [Methylobacterium terrae]|uniref:Chemotaxis protein CheW n=1 Tax=Methylobacterium terrae TaxID=2202827 RepID=A0A2U8WNE5_9HYPH|nr:chemotaxis protein CheW [Methylobacterium terrae]AWN47051.1 chemotaxis protein CheW [Methylobacterium terrae]